jgi:hypothetical protein
MTLVKMYPSLKYKLFCSTLLFVIVSGDLVVYVHTNLRLIYMQREEWLKGKTKMWDVFPHDMDFDSSVELALANLDLNEPMLELVTFDDGDPLEGTSSTLAM